MWCECGSFAPYVCEELFYMVTFLFLLLVKFTIFCNVVKNTGINHHETFTLGSVFVESPYMRNVLRKQIVPSLLILPLSESNATLPLSTWIWWAMGNIVSALLVLYYYHTLLLLFTPFLGSCRLSWGSHPDCVTTFSYCPLKCFFIFLYLLN